MGVATGGSGADYHYRDWNAYAKIMETARDLFRNHQLVGQGVRRLCANILRGGFTLDTKTGDKGLDAELSARWYEWADDPDACDVQGESNFHELEKLALQQVIVDGDCFSLPLVDGQIQQIEGHRVRTPSGTKKNVVHGILLDDQRKRLEYWVTKDDIDPLATLSRVSDITPYAARAVDPLTGKEYKQVLHHYMKDRTTQTRGITALVPVVDTAGMADDLNFATLVKAQMAACVTIFRELAGSVTLPPAVGNDGIHTTTDTRPDGTTRLLSGWQPGMEIFGFPGEKLTGFSPNVPNAEYFQHAMFLLSIIAVNLDLPVAVLMLDPSKTNFSGWRGAMDQARQRFQEIQQWLIWSMHSPTYCWKVRQWAADDPAIRQAIEQTMRRQNARMDGINAFEHVWHAQEWPYIEPVADAQGDVIQERNLLTSPRRRAARRGMDFGELVVEIMEDRERIILTAHETAQRINAAIGEELTWRDLAIFGPPEGVTVSQSKSESESTTETESPEPSDKQPENRLQRINGHAN
jgi:lambda family phage portal protein